LPTGLSGLSNLLRKSIARSAGPWGISTRAAAWIFWIPLIGVVAVLAARLDKDLYRILLADDGVVEWAQFACFLAAGLSALALSVNRSRSGHPFQGAAYAICALGLLFVTGEEIAWGQRIFGLSTPEALREINTQDELTLHNIENVLGVLNTVMLLIGLFGVAAPALNRYVKVERFGDDARFLFVPPFFLVPSFFVLFAYKLVRLTVWTEPGFTVTKYGEWSEFCLAFALFVFTAVNYGRLARHARVREVIEAGGSGLDPAGLDPAIAAGASADALDEARPAVP
jgi:hypothetical protein